MIRTQAGDDEIAKYSEEQEQKDVEKFDKYISGLNNIQLELLLTLIMDEYTNNDLSDILDNVLDISIKEELSDLWTFRASNQIGEQ